MNPFELKLSLQGVKGLYACGIQTVQVNVGLKCNLACAHCHLNAGMHRQESMSEETFALILEKTAGLSGVEFDITGGSPELNPGLKPFVDALSSRGNPVRMRTNLVALVDDSADGLPEFLKRRKVSITASLPCYLQENVDAQRGEGVYAKSIAALKNLNRLGYGKNPELALELVYNPGGPFLPPPQAVLEEAYRKELGERHGVTFTKLLTIANMPLGRFGESVGSEGEGYEKLVSDAFNPATLDTVMCRRLVNIAWDGTLYDCDFNAALGLPVASGAPAHLRDFDPAALSGRRIVTGAHCMVCAAGQGSSCGGSLAA